MQNGFITLHRKIQENVIWKHPGLVHLFIHLLLSATHKPDKFLWNGTEMELKRGQLICGRYGLSEGLSTNSSTIYKRLKVLEKLGLISVKSNNKFSIITIAKYSDYQDRKKEGNNEVTTKEQQGNTLNNVNNVNNVNKEAAVTILWNKFLSNPLLNELKKKYPDRDYKFYFLEMCDWYAAKRKKLPQNISALSNWLKNTKPDEAMQAERLRALNQAELDRKQKEIFETPLASKEKIDKIREGLKNIGKI